MTREPLRAIVAPGVYMRTLTADELTTEMLYRLAIRGVPAGKLHTEIVALVAEMIAIHDEKVPNCYEQETPARTRPSEYK